MAALIEGKYGTCYRCGSPLLGATLAIKGTDYVGHYCPECHHHTPPPPGDWTPINPEKEKYSWEKETVRDRLERSLQREGPFPA